MRIGIVINGLEGELADYSTTHWALEALGRGHEVFYIEVGGFHYRIDERVHALGHPAPKGAPRTLPEFIAAIRSADAGSQEIAVDELDVLLLRSDPSHEIRERPWARLAGVNFGRLAARRGVLVLNDPDGLDRAINKLYLQHFPREVRPEAVVTRDREVLRDFAEREGPVVIKPLTGSGGRNVFLVEDPNDVNFKQMVEAVLRDGYVLAQEYLPEAQRGDVRLFMLEGEILRHQGRPAVLRRTRPRGDMRSNLTVGGEAVGCELTKSMEEIAERLGPRLVADGMFLVGVDIVQDKVIEINVFSPGALVGASRLAGVNFFAALVDALEEKVAGRGQSRDRLEKALVAEA